MLQVRASPPPGRKTSQLYESAVCNKLVNHKWQGIATNVQSSPPSIHSLPYNSDVNTLSHDPLPLPHIQGSAPEIPASLHLVLLPNVLEVFRRRLQLVQMCQSRPPPLQTPRHEPLVVVLFRQMRLIRLPPLRPGVLPEFGLVPLAHHLHARAHRVPPVNLFLLLQFGLPDIHGRLLASFVEECAYADIEVLASSSALVPTLER